MVVRLCAASSLIGEDVDEALRLYADIKVMDVLRDAVLEGHDGDQLLHIKQRGVGRVGLDVERQSVDCISQHPMSVLSNNLDTERGSMEHVQVIFGVDVVSLVVTLVHQLPRSAGRDDIELQRSGELNPVPREQIDKVLRWRSARNSDHGSPRKIEEQCRAEVGIGIRLDGDVVNVVAVGYQPL